MLARRLVRKVLQGILFFPNERESRVDSCRRLRCLKRGAWMNWTMRGLAASASAPLGLMGIQAPLWRVDGLAAFKRLGVCDWRGA